MKTPHEDEIMIVINVLHTARCIINTIVTALYEVHSVTPKGKLMNFQTKYPVYHSQGLLSNLQ